MNPGREGAQCPIFVLVNGSFSLLPTTPPQSLPPPPPTTHTHRHPQKVQRNPVIQSTGSAPSIKKDEHSFLFHPLHGRTLFISDYHINKYSSRNKKGTLPKDKRIYMKCVDYRERQYGRQGNRHTHVNTHIITLRTQNMKGGCTDRILGENTLWCSQAVHTLPHTEAHTYGPAHHHQHHTHTHTHTHLRKGIQVNSHDVERLLRKYVRRI